MPHAYRRKGPAALAKEILASLDAYSPTMWGNNATEEERKRFEAEAKASFAIFTNSWVRPKLERIVEQTTRKPKQKP